MVKNKQLIVNNKNGDCFRACLTSILGIPNDLKLPNIDDNAWFFKWYDLLNEFGINLIFNEKSFWKQGYWIASVPSKNFPHTFHAIVMKGNEIAFDPSTKKRYKIGRNIFDADLIRSGYSLEISDVALLHKLKEL